MVRPDRSSRVERATDHGREVAFFLGEPREAVFGVFHTPAAPARGGVVICQSIFGDFIQNYRREVVLARLLAARGVAVARFHYRGFGQSAGSPLDATFESMCLDAQRIVTHFLATASIERLGFVGTRFGALVAARVSGDHTSAPVAIWEPVLSGRQFFREAFRAKKMAAVVSAADQAPKPEVSLREDGFVDVLGYALGAPLFESSAQVELTALLAQATGPALYVGRGHNDRLGKRDLGVVEAMRASGRRVDISTTAGPDEWWFIDEDNAASVEVAAGTARWLSEQLAVGK